MGIERVGENPKINMYPRRLHARWARVRHTENGDGPGGGTCVDLTHEPLHTRSRTSRGPRYSYWASLSDSDPGDNPTVVRSLS